MKMFGRAEFCLLTGMEVEAFNSLRRRDLLPLRPPREMPEETANISGYGPLPALLMIVANEAVDRHDVSRQRAARFAGMTFFVFRGWPRPKDPDRWHLVADTSAEVAAGKEPSADILLAAIDWPANEPNPKDFKSSKNKTGLTVDIGTFQEIAERHPTASSIIAVSLTRCAAVLRQRAEKHGIDLGDFWQKG
jgi:hypothetical protein